MIKSAAQRVVFAKRHYTATCTRFKNASTAHEKRVNYSWYRMRAKLTGPQVRRLEKKLDSATSKLHEANSEMAEAYSELLEAQLHKLCLQVQLRDAQLHESLRRRMRRRRIYGLFGWGRW